MTSIITVGMIMGPVTTRREAGESLMDSITRHKAQLMASVPIGDKLMTTWQIPGGQDIVATTRMTGESDEAIRERHLLAFSRSEWALDSGRSILRTGRTGAAD
jgi:hypothetical protein